MRSKNYVIDNLVNFYNKDQTTDTDLSQDY